MMNPTPYFKFAILTLGTLVLIVAAILFNAVHAAEVVDTRSVAPVVKAPDEAGFMPQIGWYRYQKQDNAVVLYCIPQSETLLVCAVFVMTPKGNAVVLVDGIKATEVPS